MSKKNVQLGDIALIPVGERKFVPVKVLYLSEYYKNVILLAMYDGMQETESVPAELPGEPALLVYASQLSITQGRWKAVGNIPLAASEKGKAKRISAGSVWLDDEELRPATDADYEELPRMEVMGEALVEKKAGELVGVELQSRTTACAKPAKAAPVKHKLCNNESTIPGDPVLAYAHLNARVQPIDRGNRYEEPLQEALEANGLGQVTGGGTMQEEDGEINFCGIDIDLIDVDQAVPFICDFLAKCGAPRGSMLQYEMDGKKHEVPFGILEGLAVYFNGTDLPDEVYEDCDINYVCSEISRLLGERGDIQGHWQGPTETVLYLYGYSVDEMKGLIAPLMSEYPLCSKARYEVIA